MIDLLVDHRNRFIIAVGFVFLSFIFVIVFTIISARRGVNLTTEVAYRTRTVSPIEDRSFCPGDEVTYNQHVVITSGPESVLLTFDNWCVWSDILNDYRCFPARDNQVSYFISTPTNANFLLKRTIPNLPPGNYAMRHSAYVLGEPHANNWYQLEPVIISDSCTEYSVPGLPSPLND